MFLILAVSLKKTDYNTKIVELENKIPDVNSLAKNPALTTVEKKQPNISSLLKKNGL